MKGGGENLHAEALHVTQQELLRAEKLITAHEAKTDDLENRGRRKNMVLLSQPEKSEASQIPA